MSERVPVTRAQQRAAQTIVERSAATGKSVRPGVAKIASSGRWASKSAGSGSGKSAASSALSQSTKK